MMHETIPTPYMYTSTIEDQKLLDDTIYYEHFLNGDNTGFDMLVLKYKDHLIFFLNRIINNITISEDLAQDAFVEILLHKERYQFGMSFKTYLFTIAHNKAVDYIRKNNKIKLSQEFPEYLDEENELENKVIKEENKKFLYHSMKQLKSDYNCVITLIDLEGLSYQEAANIMDKSNLQIKVLIHRARKSLEKIMRKDGFVYEK